TRRVQGIHAEGNLFVPGELHPRLPIRSPVIHNFPGESGRKGFIQPEILPPPHCHRLPNHWWTTSWVMTLATPRRLFAEASVTSTRRRFSRKKIAPQFSIAPIAKSGTPTRSSFGMGYFRPK